MQRRIARAGISLEHKRLVDVACLSRTNGPCCCRRRAADHRTGNVVGGDGIKVAILPVEARRTDRVRVNRNVSRRTKGTSRIKDHLRIRARIKIEKIFCAGARTRAGNVDSKGRVASASSGRIGEIDGLTLADLSVASVSSQSLMNQSTVGDGVVEDRENISARNRRRDVKRTVVLFVVVDEKICERAVV